MRQKRVNIKEVALRDRVIKPHKRGGPVEGKTINTQWNTTICLPEITDEIRNNNRQSWNARALASSLWIGWRPQATAYLINATSICIDEPCGKGIAWSASDWWISCLCAKRFLQTQKITFNLVVCRTYTSSMQGIVGRIDKLSSQILYLPFPSSQMYL